MDGFSSDRTQQRDRALAHVREASDQAHAQRLAQRRRGRAAGVGPAVEPAGASTGFSQAINAGLTAPRGGGPGAFIKANNRQEFLVLLAEAERRLTAGGMDRERALHAITSIYYGAEWSLDHAVTAREHGGGFIASIYTDNRDANFAQLTGRQFPSTDDPRPALGPELFNALQQSQDVAGIDAGHMLIGMDARMRPRSREGAQTVEPHGMIASQLAHPVATHATGAEISTWVGDLGGAASRLAVARFRGEPTSVDQWFNPRGTDYGAPTNLAGDLAGMTAGRNPGPAGPGEAPVQGNRSITQVASEAMSAPPSQRAYVFLQSLGATFQDRALTNRAAVLATMADRIESFGRFYIQAYDGAAVGLLPVAAREVANRFIDQLVRDVASGPISVGVAHDARWLQRLPDDPP